MYSKSPTVNIFQNDLHDILDDHCDPVNLNMCVNSLSWADDLVLISRSKPGLQNALDKLDRYCTKCQLNVNTKKKCISLSKGNTKNA